MFRLEILVPAARVVIVVREVLLRLIRRLEERRVLFALELGQPGGLDFLLQQLDPVKTCARVCVHVFWV